MTSRPVFFPLHHGCFPASRVSRKGRWGAETMQGCKQLAVRAATVGTIGPVTSLFSDKLNLYTSQISFFNTSQTILEMFQLQSPSSRRAPQFAASQGFFKPATTMLNSCPSRQGGLVSGPSYPASWLCDLEQADIPLCASLSSLGDRVNNPHPLLSPPGAL